MTRRDYNQTKEIFFIKNNKGSRIDPLLQYSLNHSKLTLNRFVKYEEREPERNSERQTSYLIV